MSVSKDKPDAIKACIDKIYSRFCYEELPSAEIIRQEASRAKVSTKTLETLLRLDSRFVMTEFGWAIQRNIDLWENLALALPQSLNDTDEAFHIFCELVLNLNETARCYETHFPLNFSNSIIQKAASLIRSRSSDEISSLKGPFFDLVMSEVFDNSEKNRFFTPRQLTSTIASWCNLQLGETVLDPCAGSGGFLESIAENVLNRYIKTGRATEDKSTTFETTNTNSSDFEQNGECKPHTLVNKSLCGVDKDPDAAWALEENLLLHKNNESRIYCLDSLDFSGGPFTVGSFDIVVGNPPFGDKITDPVILKQYSLGLDSNNEPVKQQLSEILFIEAFLKYAKPGGRIAILIPDGILTNAGNQIVRDYIMQQAEILAVISLPRRIFHNDAKANILLLNKKLKESELQHKLVYLASIDDLINDLPLAINNFESGPKSK